MTESLHCKHALLIHEARTSIAKTVGTIARNVHGEGGVVSRIRMRIFPHLSSLRADPGTHPLSLFKEQG